MLFCPPTKRWIDYLNIISLYWFFPNCPPTRRGKGKRKHLKPTHFQDSMPPPCNLHSPQNDFQWPVADDTEYIFRPQQTRPEKQLPNPNE